MSVGNTAPLVQVKELRKYFAAPHKSFFRSKGSYIKAVDGVSFDISRGETLGLVGESGCGKSTTARCVLRLYEPTSGEVWFDGQNLQSLSSPRMRKMRHRMQMVFQDPYSSLNPRMKIGEIVGEAIKVHHLSTNRNGYRERVAELLEAVGLNCGMMDRYPGQFSGGQRQRIGIARALAANPEFVVCDEPVSALDVSTQAQIVNLLKDLQAKFNVTYLVIAHDLSVVRHISDRIAVMYLGHIVEMSTSEELCSHPLHPYTRALLSVVPIPEPRLLSSRRRIILCGDIPSPLTPPPGCVFHPRCPDARPECKYVAPDLRKVGDSHFVACAGSAAC